MVAPRFIPLNTRTTTTAALIWLLLVILPQSVVGFASCNDSRPAFASSSASSYRSSELQQSSRVLPPDEAGTASVSLSPLVRAFRNLQERVATHRHLRQQQKLLEKAADVGSSTGKDSLTAVQGRFMPAVKQFLYQPNRMFLQAYIMAHQQAQYDQLHAYYREQQQSLVMMDAAMALFLEPTTTSLLQRLVQYRRDAQNAKLAAKYAAMESLEDRAFEICKDLGMI